MLSGKWDLDGGPGDQHRIEYADGEWDGWQNLFTDLERQDRFPHIQNLMECCVLGRSQYRQYAISPVS